MFVAMSIYLQPQEVTPETLAARAMHSSLLVKANTRSTVDEFLLCYVCPFSDFSSAFNLLLALFDSFLVPTTSLNL
jgi:hypothetical protein